MSDRPTPFGPVLVVGTGMIGCSIAGRIRQVYPAASVLGVDREPAVAEEAVALGHISAGYPLEKLPRLAGEVGLVLLAAPIDQIVALLPRVAEHCRPGSLVLDAGSTKGEICWAAAQIPRLATAEVGFIGGHPMAGARQSGPAAADPAILSGAPFVLCPVGELAEERIATAERFVAELGFLPVRLQPALHDHIVAATSHVPHLLAALLTNHVGALDENRAAGEPAYYQIAGGGLDRMTAKVTASPEMWAAIIQSNTPAVTAELRALAQELHDVAERIEAGRVLELLVAARDRRALFEMTNYRYKRRPSTR